MKTIGLNALLLSPQAGGIGVYMQNLIDRIGLEKHPDWQLKIFVSAEEYKRSPLTYQAKKFVPLSIYSSRPFLRLCKETCRWQEIIRKNAIDLFHSPISYISPGVKIPYLLTVHDLRYAHFPDSYKKIRWQFLQYAIPHSLERAEKIIAVSNFTKNDVISSLGISPEKIVVIHEGIDAKLFSRHYDDAEAEQIRTRYQLPPQYILSVGHLEPRKNYVRLLKAFSILKHKVTALPAMVIVGKKNWRAEQVNKAIRRYRLQKEVLMLDFVDSPSLPFLYQNAVAFIAPSVFEGFGFTPLESMAAGVPVAAANTSSYPEICGDAALYFDPYSPEDMAEKIHQLLADAKLGHDLVQRGLANIQKWTWDACVSTTVKLYEHCLQSI
ncbi:glycosyltransferase family 4 protein [candidate division KSB1 bacterium]|nr:glycosyltransferase family 4 protein [candidate division KSB1 bacterium]